MVEGRVAEHVEDLIAQAHGGRSVHHGVLAHDSGVCIVEDDELNRFVDPAVLQTDGFPGREIAVPQRAAVMHGCCGGGRVEAYSKCGGVDIFQYCSIVVGS